MFCSVAATLDIARIYSFPRFQNNMFGNLIRLCFPQRFLPIFWLIFNLNWITRPLCSISITEISSLIQGSPPLCSASVLSFLWGFHLNFSLIIGTTASHVSHKSLIHVHATLMPDATWTVNRFPPDSSRINDYPPVLTSSLRFRHFISGSLTFVSIESHLIPSSGTFSLTLTTTTLYRSSLRWFEACSCKPASRGPPSS